MAAASTVNANHRINFRRLWWQVVAVGGMAVASAGIVVGATGLSFKVPLPTWSLGAGALFGLVVMAMAGSRLLSMMERPEVEVKSTDAPVGEDNPWVLISHAFEGWRTGQVPVLIPPQGADEREIAAFERGNDAFQFLAKRRKVLRAALSEVREEMIEYHRYLTKSQVGLIGANSVAERLEDLDKRLAKIRAAV